MCSNLYDDVTDFEVCGFVKNTSNVEISRTKNKFFFRQVTHGTKVGPKMETAKGLFH